MKSVKLEVFYDTLIQACNMAYINLKTSSCILLLLLWFLFKQQYNDLFKELVSGLYLSFWSEFLGTQTNSGKNGWLQQKSS